MSITEADFKAFFQKVEAAAETIEDAAEKELAKGIAAAGQFLRSTAAALAKDPVLLAAIQAGMSGAIAFVIAAVETGGTAALPAAALEAGKSLVISAGGTAEHELMPIVTGEIQAAVASVTQATPEHANP